MECLFPLCYHRKQTTYNVIHMNVMHIRGALCAAQFATQKEIEHGGEYAYAFVHCDTLMGEIFAEKPSKRSLVKSPPNVTVYRFGLGSFYACYAGPSFSYEALLNLAATEMELNKDAVRGEWDKFLRVKLSNVKKVHGAFHAMKWFQVYSQLLPIQECSKLTLWEITWKL